MSFTIDDFHDLIRLMEARPEWRVELRRLVLTNELLGLPEQLAELRLRSEEQFQELLASHQHLEGRVDTLTIGVEALAAAQQRTEARLEALIVRVDELAAAQQRTEVRLEALIVRVDELAAAQQRTEARLEALTTRVDALTEALQQTQVQVATLVRIMQTLTTDVGTLKGKSLEAEYRAKGAAYFSRIVRRPHVLRSDELVNLLEDACDHGQLSYAEVQDVYQADVVVRGRLPQHGTEVYLVVEVSWGVGSHDVSRAARRAALLARLGLTTMPVVAGESILPEAAELAQRSKVWQVTDGTAIPPDAVVL